MRKTAITVLTSLLIFTTAASAGWEEAVAAFKSRDYARAESELRGVIAASPDWPGGYLLLGQTLLRDGRAEAAVEPLEKALELAPESADTRLVLAQTYLHAGRAGDAYESLEGMDASALPEPKRAVLYETRGRAALASDRSEAAVADLGEAAHLSPGDADIHYLVGKAQLDLGRSTPAVESLARAAELAPEDAKTLRAWVRALGEQSEAAGDGEKAEICTRAADAATRLAALEDSYEHLMLLGEAERCAGRKAAAMASFERALERQPESWRPRYYLGRAAAAAAEPRSEQLAGVARSLEAALEAAGSDAERRMTHRVLGFVYEKQWRFDRAIEAYTLAGDAEGAERARESREIAADNDRLERLAEKERELLEELEELDGRRR